MSCCGKKRKPSDPGRPTLASPIGALKPPATRPDEPRSARRDKSRDAPVTTR